MMSEIPHDQSTEQRAVEQARSRIEARLLSVIDELPDAGLVDRLTILERYAPRFNRDAFLISHAIDEVSGRMNDEPAVERQISLQERYTARAAAMFHDIGKTGPANATPEQSRAIVELFALDTDDIRASTIIADAIRSGFDPQNAERIESALTEMGIDQQQTMRWLWDQHATWTHGILSIHEDTVEESIRVIASSHHIDQGINPAGIPIETIMTENSTTLEIGLAEYHREYDLMVKMLIAADKDEAQRFRKRREGGPERPGVLGLIGERFRNDERMTTIAKLVDELGDEGVLFQYADVIHEREVTEDDTMTWSVPARTKAIPTFVQEIEQRLRIAGWSMDEMSNTLTVVSEAMSNAVIHGTLGVTMKSEKEQRDAHIRSIEQTTPLSNIRCAARIDADRILMTITDSGAGFDVIQIREKGLKSVDGDTSAEMNRGIGVMEALVGSNRIAWNEKGNEVTFVMERNDSHSKT